ncbi:MAG: pyridoxal-phosphate dependent enzyme [Candidatus Eiseniibacteriota bacterium]
MARLGLERDIVDRRAYDRTVARFREAKIRLPTFAELEDPSRIGKSVTAALASVDPDAPDPRNLFRVHWYNDASRAGRVDVPDHLVLPKELTGVDAPIVVALGANFPMIAAHKVLAAYGCLAPRLVTGQFDPTAHRAVWPSTGNYCRGGVAISRIMKCRGVAVLPAGMSRERFDWLAKWVADEGDVIKTPGTESNVKEIYDECKRLDADPANIIFNQFCEFGNHLVHWLCTGAALDRVFEHLAAARPRLRAAAFVSATGSAGTLGAGDRLKDAHGAKIVAVEALECPTLLLDGYGEHNIQGIGDKHVPLIHNVMNTDFVAAVTDRATDAMNVVFNGKAGRSYLVSRRRVPERLVERLGALGLSSLANVFAAIQLAKHQDLGPDDAVLTVATDSAAMYASERAKTERAVFGGELDETAAAQAFGEHVLGQQPANFLECTRGDRLRIFHLGYFTWVEQQGVSLAEFDARKSPAFWTGLRELVPAWDAMIAELNARAGTANG